MTDGGTAFEPGMEELRAPFRPRNSYAGYRAFGSGEGAVLVDPKVTRALRSAAESATQERRVTGGLLYGTAWADDQGLYQVIDGYVEAGPGENSGDRIAADGTDNFSLSDADLRLLREDGARMYSGSFEAGWWRTLPAPGEFSPRDFATQGQLGPDGVGLLVYGSTPQWGTAYLGPDGRAPDSAGTLVAVPEPGAGPAPGAGLAPEPEMADIAAGPSLAQEPRRAGAGTTAAGPTAAGPAPAAARRRVRRFAAPPGAPQGAPRRRVRPTAPVGAGTRRWVARRATVERPRETPADVQLVVIALAVVFVAAAIIIGVLVHSLTVAVVIAVIGLLVVFGSVWFSRR